MFNPFDDERAVSFVKSLVQGKSSAPVRMTLDKAAKQAKKSWLDDSHLCDKALAAAAVVAAARGQAGKIPVPDELTLWITKCSYAPSDTEAQLAAEIVEVIRSNSMLQEIVDDAGWPAWKRGCTELAKRLRQPAKPLAQVKANGKPAAEHTPAAARKALEKKRGEFFNEDGQLQFSCWSENALTDAEMPLLGRITDLRRVAMGEQAVTDDGFQHLASLANLESLNLGGSKIGPAGLAHLLPLKKLRALAVRQTATDELLKVVGRMANLHSLDIYNAEQITDAGLRSLAGLQQLAELDIGNVQSDGGALAVIPAGKLKRLSARGLKFSEAGAKALGRFRSLEELNLGSCQFTSNMVKQLAGLTKLKELSLFDVKGLSDGVFAHLAKLTALIKISFYNAKTLTGKGIGALTALKKLEELDLRSTGVADADVGRLGELPKLRELDLGHSAVVDNSLEGLTKSKSIVVLNLADTKITGAGVVKLATMKSLRELSLQSVKLSDDVADELLKMTWLKELSILFTGITPGTMRKIRRGLKKTQVTIDP